MPYESITNTMRRAFLASIDVLVLFFVVSRTCTSRRAIVEVMVSFCLSCAIYAPLALFETLKHWLLYQGIGIRWGSPDPFAFLMRAGALRAQVSAGHSITLGVLLAIAFGFWLYLRTRARTKLWPLAFSAWIWGGLLAAYARAPWIVALSIYFSFLGIGPARCRKSSAGAPRKRRNRNYPRDVPRWRSSESRIYHSLEQSVRKPLRTENDSLKNPGSS